MPSSETAKPVRISWKAKGSLKTSLYRDGTLVAHEFRPRDEYKTTITNTSVFKILADYGNGETAEQITQATISSNGRVKEPDGIYNPHNNGNGNGNTDTIFNYQSPIIELNGTVNRVLAKFSDLCSEQKVKEIELLEISVDQEVDYRRLGTKIPLLNRYNIGIEQTVMLQTGDDQFVRLEYQGQVKGFQSFFNTINGLLNNPATKGDVNLKLIIDFADRLACHSSELNSITQALSRQPVMERISFSARVKY